MDSLGNLGLGFLPNYLLLYRLFFSATTLHVYVTSTPEDPSELLSLQLLLMSVMGLHLELPVFEPFYTPALMYSRYVVLRNLNTLFQHKDVLSTFCMITFIVWSEAVSLILQYRDETFLKQYSAILLFCRKLLRLGFHPRGV